MDAGMEFVEGSEPFAYIITLYQKENTYLQVVTMDYKTQKAFFAYQGFDTNSGTPLMKYPYDF